MNSLGNRNQGVGLSSIKPLFQMENSNLDFKWKVDLIYIHRLRPNLKKCSRGNL